MQVYFEQLNIGPAPEGYASASGTEQTRGNPLTDSPIPMEEVESAISQLKTHKAPVPGWNGLLQ